MLTIKIIPMPLIIFMVACSDHKDCQSLIEKKDYSSAIPVCRQAFKNNAQTQSLKAWITSIGETGRIEEFKNILPQLKNKKMKANSMLLAAQYFYGQQNMKLAKKYYSESAEIFSLLNTEKQLIKSLNGAFKVAWSQSDHRRALHFASRALEVSIKAKDRQGEIDALHELFIILQEIGSLGSAQHVMNLLDKRLVNDTQSGMRINSYIGQGLLNMDLHQFGMALHNFNQALKAASGSKNSRALRGLQLDFVHVNIKLNRLKQAEFHMNKAWSYANKDSTERFALLYYQSLLQFHNGHPKQAYLTMKRALEEPDLPSVWLWEMYFWEGKAAHAMGDEEKAIKAYNQSIEASEQLRHGMGYEQIKSQFLNQKRQAYEALFIEYFQSGNLLQAFEISERVKSRGFIQDFIQSSQIKQSSDWTQYDQIFYQQTSDRIDNLKNYLRLMRISPIFVDQNITNVISLMKGKNFISYFYAEKRLFLLSVIKQKLHINEINFSQEKLDRLIYDYQDDPGNLDILNTLGKLLLPENALPETSAHIYFSPDKAISGIALSSLRINSQFLIERNTLSLVPNASSLIKIKSHNSVSTPNKADFIVMGDPENNLPAARQEVIDIANKLNTRVHLGEDASFAIILQNKQPQILHLATHSGVNYLGSWLRFSNADIPAITFMDQKIRPNLAMLVSCGSAEPVSSNIWGSLAGSFLSSGTSSVVATLWSIEDNMTEEMMNNFYSQYLKKLNSAEALRFSQLSAIKQGKPVQQWGALILIGVPTKLSTEVIAQLAHVN